jgi:hypothetical protein
MYINIRYGIKLDFYVRSLIYAYDPWRSFTYVQLGDITIELNGLIENVRRTAVRTAFCRGKGITKYGVKNVV